MSTTDINAQLDEAENELYMIINAQKRLQIVENEIDIVEHNIRAQGVVMKEELADVERLEKNGVSALFQKVLGNHEEQLEKERQEYLQEVLTYNSYIDELAFVENFYDGLITDWIIVKKLQVALNSTIAATHKVNRLLSMLNTEKEKINTTLEKRKKERESFIKKSQLS